MHHAEYGKEGQLQHTYRLRLTVTLTTKNYTVKLQEMYTEIFQRPSLRFVASPL